MDKSLINAILLATGARDISSAESVQTLWSGYGEIMRLWLAGGAHASVILKHVRLPDAGSHPRGWNTDLSHRRKVHSYHVEAHWYQHYAALCTDYSPVPACLAVQVFESETMLLLTDLDALGFDHRKEVAGVEDIHACLDWLANFHARFLGSSADGLWESGCYWHLDTRPDELAALDDTPLRVAAPLIDQQLRQCRYQTLVHGDAKLANFCFTDDTAGPKVAAVDFQYVGRGCGMKDVAYFIGSCLREDECEALAGTLLDYYFAALKRSVSDTHTAVDVDHLEREWRGLYDVAWADFHRFLKGWSPGHWKINGYSEKLTRGVIERLQS